MTKETALGLSQLLQAFANGKIIQMNTLNGWKDINPIIIEELIQASTLFPDTKCLRIKPELKLVPFTFEDNHLFRDKWVKYKGCLPLFRITCFGPKGVCYSEGNEWESYEKWLEKYEFEDGSPCGKYVEE